MERALVIGCPGAGKSTFARRLRDLTGLPIVYLDRLYWNADRTTVSRETFDARLAEALARPRWIIDGNFSRTMPVRLAACDTVFLFDLPVDVCLPGAAARIGQAREDMPWIEERFDPEFRQYILDFPRDQLPVIEELIARHRGQKRMIVFRTRTEAEQYLDGMRMLTEEETI